MTEFDAQARALADHLEERFAGGAELADREVETLAELAHSIASALDQWRALVAKLELAKPLDPRRGGVLVLESAFDEVLPAPEWRVLAAAFARIDSPR